MSSEAAQERTGVKRRDFLLKAAIGAAAVVGVGAFARRWRWFGASRVEANPLGLDEDSIFWPREDQLKRFLDSK